MSEGPRKLHANLMIISRIDIALAALAAQRKKTENELTQLQSSLRKAESEKVSKSKLFDEKQTRYQREEKKIRDERDKLINRRKALTTLSNYKLQQAAEREIEQASRQLDTHEEAVLKVLEEADIVSNELKAVDAQVQELTLKLSDFEGEAQKILSSIEEKQKVHLEEKAEVLKQVEPKAVTVYERVQERFPGDAVVALTKETYSCSGCFMQLGPQIVVEIQRSNSVIRCRGCGRILALEENEEE